MTDEDCGGTWSVVCIQLVVPKGPTKRPPFHCSEPRLGPIFIVADLQPASVTLRNYPCGSKGDALWKLGDDRKSSVEQTGIVTRGQETDVDPHPLRSVSAPSTAIRPGQDPT